MDEPPKRVSSFEERLGKVEYFTGAGHLNILVSIRKDLAAKVPMLVLTGEEGCGKSVMAKMIASETRPGCIPVYLEQTVDSFEEVISAIAAKTGIEVRDLSRKGVATAVEQIASRLSQRGERLLLICDDAERIYLATLERLRKMMERLNRAVVSMQMVLVGRTLLLDNLRQLSICNFEEVDEQHYVLEPLTFSETRSYLEFCRKRLSEEDNAIFVPEVIDRLYQESEGNFKQIHYIAEQLCSRYNKDASFWVLLENVESGKTTASRLRGILGSLLLANLSGLSRRNRILGVGAVLLGLSLLLYLAGGDKPDTGRRSIDSGVTVSNQPQAEVVAAPPSAQPPSLSPPSEKPEQATLHPETEPLNSPPSTAQNVTGQKNVEAGTGKHLATAPSPAVSTTAEVVTQKDETDSAGEPAAAPVKVMSADEALLAEAQEAVEIARSQAGQPRPPGMSMSPEGSGANRTFASEPQRERTVAITAPAVIPTLHAVQAKRLVPETDMAAGQKEAEGGGDLSPTKPLPSTRAKIMRISGDETRRKIRTDSPPLNRGITEAQPQARGEQSALHPTGVAGAPGDFQSAGRSTADRSEGKKIVPETKKLPVLRQVIVPEKMVKADSSRGVYPARVKDGGSWLAGERDKRFTVQVMVLSSGAREENVEDVLGRKEYADAARNFYVFERKSGSPSVYVFFGEYATLAEAKVARDALPDALQKQKPYVLTVQEAMQKVK